MQKIDLKYNTALAKSIGLQYYALLAVVAVLTTATTIGGLQTVQAEPKDKSYCKGSPEVGLACIGASNKDSGFNDEFGCNNVKQCCVDFTAVPGSDFGEGKCSRDKDLENLE
jgi:hypothetical protein